VNPGSSIIIVLLPCSRVANWRRRYNGFVRYVPDAAGVFNTLLPTQIFGHVPVGPFIRFSVAHMFTSLKLDILSCTAEEVSLFCVDKIFNIIYLFLQVSDWRLTTTARLINVECVPASSATAFTIRRLVTDYVRCNVASLGDP